MHLDVDDSVWFCKQPSSSQNLYPASRYPFYHNYGGGQSQFPGDIEGLDVCTTNSATGSLQDVYNLRNLEKAPVGGSSEHEEIGIKIRPRQPPYPAPSTDALQGAAMRRIHLQTRLQVQSACSSGNGASSCSEDREVCSNIEVRNRLSCNILVSEGQMLFVFKAVSLLSVISALLARSQEVT